MKDKRVMLISGTRTGLGLHLAAHYVNDGFHVIGCSRGPCEADLPNYTHFRLDVADEKKVRLMFSEIGKAHGRLDALINNAGTTSVNHALLTPVKTVRDVYDTNVLGVFLLSREAVKLMKRRSYGRIVNISSIHVPLCTEGSSVYSASKAAVEQFSRVISREVASFGVTVNALGLSFVDGTGMVELLGDKAVSDVLDRTALKSRIMPADVSNAIDFLVSEKSAKVTGQVIYI